MTIPLAQEEARDVWGERTGAVHSL